MSKHRYVLALDPSGNWVEGKGTTGVCLYDNHKKQYSTLSLHAKDYACQEAYWDAHIFMLQEHLNKYGNKLVVVVEDYILYAQKANNQINSYLETPRLIGVLQWFCYTKQIPCYLEPASAVKNRWNNSVLEHKNIIVKTKQGFTLNDKPINRHCLDAIRHATHYDTFMNK